MDDPATIARPAHRKWSDIRRSKHGPTRWKRFTYRLLVLRYQLLGR